jgi:glutathione S-transferase
MSLTLIGSIPSPYVRRIRMVLKDREHNFETIDLSNMEDQVKLSKISPIRRIPILKDGDDYIYDSRQIHRHLCPEKLSIDEENDLTFIDGANDSLIALRLLNSSGVSDQENTFIRNQNKRIKDTLNYFEEKISNVKIDEDNYVQISLYCLVDWILFRELLDISNLKNLISFKEEFSKFEYAKKSSPYQ